MLSVVVPGLVGQELSYPTAVPWIVTRRISVDVPGLGIRIVCIAAQDRSLEISAQARLLEIMAQDRSLTVLPTGGRTLTIPAQTRVITIPAEETCR